MVSIQEKTWVTFCTIEVAKEKAVSSSDESNKKKEVKKVKSLIFSLQQTDVTTSTEDFIRVLATKPDGEMKGQSKLTLD